MSCLTYERQLPLLEGREAAQILLPREEPWGLVTWSMGTWAGALLSKVWGLRAPRFWLALSPFLDLVGPGCRVSVEAHRVLLLSLKNEPLRTLEFFGGHNGAKVPWFSAERVLELREEFERGLELLGRPGPRPVPSPGARVIAALGREDRLVSPAQAEAFAALHSGASVLLLQGLGHGLFYEEPAQVAALLAELGC